MIREVDWVCVRLPATRQRWFAEALMSENGVEKDFGPIDRVKEVSGIYGLGFERESFLGFALPFAFVAIVGGLGALIILFWL
jgi:hypothetical protein